MAIHTRLQLDPRAEISLRTVREGTKDAEVKVIEILILDPDGEASAVIELSAEQYVALSEGKILDLRQG